MYVAFHKTGTCFCFFLSCQAAAAGKEKTSFALSSLRSRPGADYPACFCLSQFYVSLQKQIGASGDFPFIRVLVVLASVVMHDANVIIISGRRPDGNYISFPLFKALRLQIPFVCSSIFHHHSSSRPQPDLPFRQSARLSACIGGTGYSRHFRRAWQHTPAF